MANNNINVDAVNAATQAELNAHTEQALLELVYVRTANELLGTAMGNLDSALGTTQSIINILTGLQNLKNQLSIKSKSAFGFDYTHGTVNRMVIGNEQKVVVFNSGGTLLTIYDNLPRDKTTTTPTGSTRLTLAYYSATATGFLTQYQTTYQVAASDYFGTPIDPFFAFSGPGASGYAAFLSSIKAFKSSLNLTISSLFRQTPPASRNDPNGLLAQLRKVYNGLPSDFSFSSVEKWVLDNYNVHGSSLAGSAGSLQNDLTFAITGAQSLNDSQKEKVRRFLFIFQEYYQSASAVLTAISQIVTKMAQKISQ